MILRNVSLKEYNTFGLDYKAELFFHIKSEEEAISYLSKEKLPDKPCLIIGEGSNLLFTHDYIGTVIYPEIKGIEIEEKERDEVIISSGSGVKWDNLVEWTVNQGFGGLENLSLIPGMVGAAPVQNIGAYGVEAKDTVEKVRAVLLADGSVKEFNNEECKFSYRNSIFKGDLKGKYLITKVWFRLSTNPTFNTNYGSLKEEAEKLGPLTLKTIRQAVINIRTEKLPDPVKIGNAGSFFKNPLIDKFAFGRLKIKYPDIPAYDDPSGNVKVAAGWLIDQCGWKGRKKGNAGVHAKQALVIVNHGNATGSEILNLAEEIEQSVLEKFGIKLEREVEVI